MPQPNKGSAGTPNISQPIQGEKVTADKGEVMFGQQPGGTRGTK